MLSNPKSKTSMSKIMALIILLPVSFVLLHIGLTISNTVYFLNAYLFVPSSEIGLVDVIDILFSSFIGLGGIVDTISIFFTWVFPITILIAILSKLNLGTWLPKWLILQTQGFIGRLLTFLRITSFDGRLILEEQLEVDEVPISSIEELVKSIITHSKGILIVPIGIAALILVFLGGELVYGSPALILWDYVNFLPPLISAIFFLDIKLMPLILYIIVLLLSIIFVVLFFPAVTILRQCGLRIVKTDSNNEVVKISNLGDNIFSLVGNIFGISAVFLLTGTLVSFARLNYETSGLPDLIVLFINAIIRYPISFVYAFTYLFVLITLFLPASGFLLLDLFPERIITAVKQIRVQILQEGIARFGDVELIVERAD